MSVKEEGLYSHGHGGHVRSLAGARRGRTFEANGGWRRRARSAMEVVREKWGRGWRVRPKMSREKGCRVRQRQRHFVSRRAKEKRRRGGLSRREKTEAAEGQSDGDGQAGELHPEEEEEERAVMEERGKGERKEPEPESLEGQRGPKQREPEAGDPPGPEGEGPRAASSKAPEEEKREDVEQKEGEGEHPRGAAEQQENRAAGRPDGQEEDIIAAELSGAKGRQTAAAKRGSPMDEQRERGEERGLPAGQQEPRRAEGLEPLKEPEDVRPGEAAQGLKEEEIEKERVEGGFSECQEGAGDIDERTTGDSREIEMRQSGAGKFNSKIILNHDGGIVQELVIPDIKGAGVD